MSETAPPQGAPFSNSDITALSHLYRGEVYRSTVWRMRLDATTNWAVVTTGLALSLSFATPEASPLPLALVGLLVAVFLTIEARRYRVHYMWRVRTHILELNLFGPILRGESARVGSWSRRLSEDYERSALQISTLYAVGHRLRKNYGLIFAVQVTSYIGKLLIHPNTITSFGELWERAAIGPLPGELVLLAGLTFHSTWILIALFTIPRGTRILGATE